MKKDIAVSDFILKDNAVWCSSIAYNYIFEVNKTKGNVIEIYRIPYDTPFLIESIKFIVDYDKDSILLPTSSKNIVYKFNVKDKSFSFFEDTFLCKMRKVTDVFNGILYGVDGETNNIYTYNLYTFQVEKHSVGKDDDKFILIQKNNDKLVVLTSDETIYVLNDLLDKYKIVPISLQEKCFIKNCNYSFSTCVAVKDTTVWLFPQYADRIIKLDLQNYQLEGIEIDYENIEYCFGQIFTSAHVIGDQVLSYSEWKGEWKIWNFSGKVIKKAKSNLNNEHINKLFGESIINNPYEPNYVFCEVESKDICLTKLINDLK